MPLGERFLFDESFDEKDLARAEAEAEARRIADEAALMEPEIITPTFTEDEVEEARKDGFKAGHEAGIKEASGEIDAKIKDSLEIIADRMDDLFESQASDAANTFTDSVNIAVTIARKSFPHLNETSGFHEIERMVQEVLTEVLEEPRVIIYVNSTLKDMLEARLELVTKKSNFEGQIIILEDDTLEPGDCRITWSNGSAERNLEGIIRKIEQIVEDTLSGISTTTKEPVQNKSLTNDLNSESETATSDGSILEVEKASKPDLTTLEPEIHPDTNSPPYDSAETKQETVDSAGAESGSSQNDEPNTETYVPLSEAENNIIPEVKLDSDPENVEPIKDPSIPDDGSSNDDIDRERNQNATTPNDPNT